MLGIFDSGIGGLTVVKEIFKNLPKYQIIYFGDAARLPYGTKGTDFIKRYSAKIIDWLIQKKAKIIIIACHTSSAWASDFLKKRFNKIPIFEVISPALNEVLSAAESKRIGIIGTPGTIKSGSWKKKLLAKDPSLKIYSKSCPLFVPLIEEGWINKKITREIVKKNLEPLKLKKIDVLVLACTHYPLLEKEIKKVLGKKIKIINPAESLVKSIKLFFKNNPDVALKIKKGKNHQFYFSDEPYNFNKISMICLKEKINPRIIKDPFN